MEHLVPEQMFSTDTQKAEGISAVKALAIASQQGQKVWTITESNLELALSKINLGVDTENDIRNSVYAGKVVTAHEAKINFNGWIGEGYISFDPTTGSGAYQIAGGGNGSFLTDETISGLSIIAIFFAVISKLFKLSDFGRYVSLFSFFLKLLDITARCSSKDAHDLILGLTALTILSVFLSWAIASFFVLGPVGAIFVYYVMSEITNAILDSSISMRKECNS